MNYEHVFSIAGNKAVPLAQTELAAEGFLERQHLQEWLIQNPQILGDDVMIVTSEFDRWQTSAGDSKKDRLDVLGIDSAGQLVLAELKRGPAASHVDLQALKYAALVSRFDPDTLVDAHRRFMTAQQDRDVDHDEARISLEQHIEGPLEADKWVQPSIVLVANSFAENITNTVVWLSEAGLDIVLVRYQLYGTQTNPLLVVSQMYPTPETEEFILAPKREEIEQTKAKVQSEKRRRDAVKILAAEKALALGTRLHLEPHGINENLREAVNEWLTEEPTRAEGSWTGDPSEPVEWAYTGTRGKPSTFATQALENAAGVRRSLNGSRWWCLEDGRTLGDVAAEYVEATRKSRDWSDVHEVLDSLPPGRWTTYGDLAETVGTAAMPLGGHLASCRECTNAVQVLTADGSVAENFAWHDPNETRTPRQVLEASGIAFTPDGRADPSKRLSLAELEDLASEPKS